MRRHPSNGGLSERLLRAVKGLVNSGPEAESQEDTCRKLYLDLLVNTLCNVIYRDPSNDGPAERQFEWGRREIGEDWPVRAHTMVGLCRLNNLRDLAQRAIDGDIAGHFIETGVWRGGSCILMRGVLAANSVSDRKVFVADSFAGIPPPRPALYPADDGRDFSIHHQLAVPLDEVKNNFARYGLLDDQVVFVQGLFHETLPKLETGPLALIRLDGDLYESTYVALAHLYSRLSPGGFVIVDDYGALPNCKAAVVDFRSKNEIDAPLQVIDWTGVWWQKP
jgi:O-methyltransferase